MIRLAFMFSPVMVLWPVFVFSQIVLPEVTLSYRFYADAGGKPTPLDTANRGQRIVIYLNGTSARTDNINSLGRESIVFDSRQGTGFMTREYSGQKLLIPLTSAEWQEQNSLYSSLQFMDEEGVFPVQGYSCKKTRELRPPGKIYSYTVYYDPSIQTPNKAYELAFPQLKGLPVLVEMRYEQTIYRLELVDLNREAVNPYLFELPRKGYKTIPFKDLKGQNKK
jgi:hypothetical protein